MHYLLNGHSLVLAPELCNGCHRCEEVCPHAVFAFVDHKAIVAHREDCMECGACRMNCSVGAIQVSSGVGCAAAIIASMGRPGKDGRVTCECG